MNTESLALGVINLKLEINNNSVLWKRIIINLANENGSLQIRKAVYTDSKKISEINLVFFNIHDLAVKYFFNNKCFMCFFFNLKCLEIIMCHFSTS